MILYDETKELWKAALYFFIYDNSDINRTAYCKVQ